MLAEGTTGEARARLEWEGEPEPEERAEEDEWRFRLRHGLLDVDPVVGPMRRDEPLSHEHDTREDGDR